MNKENSIKPTASHEKTNEVILDLIKNNLAEGGKVLDFGAGQGYMSQFVGQFLESKSLPVKQYLMACDINASEYKYNKAVCRQVEPNGELPYSDLTFDLIYAIEVVEHLSRPYDFFVQSYSKLKPGGRLLFSVPNILNMKSRLRFFLTGYHEMFEPSSIEEKNAGRLYGHIMPLSYINFHYGLRKAGFTNFTFHVDRKKRGAMFLASLLYPLLRFKSMKMEGRLKQSEPDIHVENDGVIPFVNSFSMLSSRSCIIVAEKPYG